MNAIIIVKLFLAIFLAGHRQPAAQKPNGDQILGEWLSAHKDGRILIYKKDQKYYGKIIWGVGYPTKDIKNQDLRLRSRDLIGINILDGFVFGGKDTWEDGTIYLPGAGKTYSCILTLKSVQQLKVRGYVGSTIFGKTEYWTRINK